MSRNLYDTFVILKWNEMQVINNIFVNQLNYVHTHTSKFQIVTNWLLKLLWFKIILWYLGDMIRSKKSL